MSSEFPETRWSLVLRLRSPDEDEAATACAEICRNYWVPLYQFLRFQGDSREQAEDVVQGFFAKLLEKGWLKSVEPLVVTDDAGNSSNRGRLRSYLLSCLRAYRAKVYRHDHAMKRGGKHEQVFGDFSEAESGVISLTDSGLRPDELYDRAWALAVIKRATDRLKLRYEKKGRGDDYTRLEPFLNGDAPGALADLARRDGEDEGKLRSDLHRLRKRLRECIHEEVNLTLDPASGISCEEELANLQRALL